MAIRFLQIFSFKSGRESETTKIFLTEKVIVRVASITMPSFCLKITHMSLSHSKGEDYIRM